MITEDYVSFEIAKLLEKKGFNEPCNKCWHIETKDIEDVYNGKNSDLASEFISAPTIQMAMKWLRKVHHLFIGCEPRLGFTDFYWITANIYRVRKKSSLYHTEDVDDYRCVACCDSHSYEEACKAAIKYCLENLI